MPSALIAALQQFRQFIFPQRRPCVRAVAVGVFAGGGQDVFAVLKARRLALVPPIVTPVVGSENATENETRLTEYGGEGNRI